MELEEVHLAALALTALVILYSDHHAFAYFLGKKQTLTKGFVVWSHRLVWLGLITMITTGVIMVTPRWEHFLADPVFYIKMGMVGVLMVNGFAIGKLSHVATQTPFANLLPEQKRTLLLSGSLSAIGWISSALIGFFFL